MKLKPTLFAIVLFLVAAGAQARSSVSLNVKADRLTLDAARHQLRTDERELRHDRRSGRLAAEQGDAQKLSVDRGRIEQAETFLERDLSKHDARSRHEPGSRDRGHSLTAAR